VIIYTVGHSTHPLDEFLVLLQTHEIARIADVRTVPKSRRHPHFSREALTQSLPAAGVGYRHFGELGGLRKPRPDSRNTAWRNASFRGYADHMETVTFEAALKDLVEWSVRPTVMMCAEAVWWQCHRQLIADALVARGWRVAHIVSTGVPTAHVLTGFARVQEQAVSYPGLV